MPIAGSSCFIRLYAFIFTFPIYICLSLVRRLILLSGSVPDPIYIYSYPANYCYILIPLCLLFTIAVSVGGCFTPQYPPFLPFYLIPVSPLCCFVSLPWFAVLSLYAGLYLSYIYMLVPGSIFILFISLSKLFLLTGQLTDKGIKV